MNKINIGFEKISLCQNALDFNLVNSISSSIGSQSLVLHFDYRQDFLGRYSFYVNRGQTKLSIKFDKIIEYVTKCSPGEVVFQSIELDGTKNGLDQKFIRNFNSKFPIPIKFNKFSPSKPNNSKMPKATVQALNPIFIRFL